MQTSFLKNIFRRFKQNRSLAASPVTDDNFFPRGMSQSYSDRNNYDRDKILAECLRAWRVNPMARAIVKLTTAFIVGDGFDVSSKHKATNKFLTEWWNHPLNALDAQLPEWSDERVRSGNLFFLVTVNPMTGMSFFRAVPAEQIKEIQSAENDVMQEKYFIPQSMNQSPYPAYDPTQAQESFMLHYAVNRPVGSQWGEPALAPMLVWIGRYANWLEDRVRLNRFRNAFMYVVQGTFASKGEKEARQRELNANPPQSGSILVTDPSEQWGIISANLDAFDASVDGLAVKRMVATGALMPMHWFAEPESSTRTTAEAAGTPTFRTLRQDQNSFIAMIEHMTYIALQIRKRADARVNADADVKINASDMTERDNANLALAMSRAYPILADLFDRDGIDEDELLRQVYRMGGEVAEKKEVKMKRRSVNAQPIIDTPPNPNKENVK